VRVAGVVTLRQGPAALFLQDQTGGLLVRLSRPQRVGPGDRVEAVGFAEAGPPAWRLEQAVLRRTGSGPPPEPAPLPAARALGTGAQPGLVYLEARLVEVADQEGQHIFLVRDGGRTFEARLAHARADGLPSPLEPGSVLGLTGVCLVTADERGRARSFRLLLRGGGDVVVLRGPPWWTPRRALVLAGGLAALAAAALAWVVSLRRQVRRQAGLIRHRLLTVQEEERRHLARELHDELGQVLATINCHLHAAKGAAGAAALPRLEACGKLLQHAGEQVRSLALELRPALIDVLGLEATLRWLAERHQQRTGCAVGVAGHLSGGPLPPDLAIACFRVVQEALTNVARHAAARDVSLVLGQTEAALEVAVRDDGVGFDVGPTRQRAARRGSLGLLGMAERVQLLGGGLCVESRPGCGTLVRASFPLARRPGGPADPAG
jgi:signal transduction histidine kinase